MARRRAGDFDALLDSWARWLCEPDRGIPGGGQSLLARWMDARGQLVFSGGARSAPVPIAGIEETIELAVVEMGKATPLREDVLRLEYAAGWWRVAQRRGLVGYDPAGLTQLQNALHLGVSVRTYRQRLGEARTFVAERLGKQA